MVGLTNRWNTFLGLIIPIWETRQPRLWNKMTQTITFIRSTRLRFDGQPTNQSKSMIHCGPGSGEVVLPVIKLEMMRGRMSIFSILMSISPGKAINMTTSGWRGDAKRRSPPHTAPRMTPRRERGKYLNFCFAWVKWIALGVQWHWPFSYLPVIWWWITCNENTIG